MERAWEKEFTDLCMANKIEPMVEGSEYLLIVPKMPPQEVQDKLRALIPQDVQYRYVEGPRLVTTIGLKTMFHQIGGITAQVEMKDHTMTFRIEGDAPVFTEEDSQALGFMKSILGADPFVEDWKVMLNGTTIYDTKVNKMLAMQVRPERDTCPTQDDIMNLRISLEVCQDVDEFINSL